VQTRDTTQAVPAQSTPALARMPRPEHPNRSLYYTTTKGRANTDDGSQATQYDGEGPRTGRQIQVDVW
jgi:hypothetical protein